MITTNKGRRSFLLALGAGAVSLVGFAMGFSAIGASIGNNLTGIQPGMILRWSENTGAYWA